MQTANCLALIFKYQLETKSGNFAVLFSKINFRSSHLLKRCKDVMKSVIIKQWILPTMIEKTFQSLYNKSVTIFIHVFFFDPGKGNIFLWKIE